MPEVHVQPLTYEVTCVPGEPSFAVFVEYRGAGRWAVCRFKQCLSRMGEWEWESTSSNREDDFLDRCRFSFEDALELAKQQAPRVRVNGYSVEDMLSMQG